MTKSTAQKPSAAPSPDQLLAHQVDELGDIDKTLAPLRAMMSRETLLKAAIRSRFDAAAPDKTFTAAGSRYVAELGWRGMEKAIDYPRLIKAIGLKMFSNIAKVTLKVLEEKVGCGIVADVVTSANTGFRSLKITERGGLPAGKAATP